MFKIRIIRSRPNNKRQKRSYNTIRKMMIMITVVVMMLSSISVYAEWYDVNAYSYIEAIYDNNGDILLPCAVGYLVKCPRCSNGYANLLCETHAYDVDTGSCYFSYHQDKNCHITTRYYYHNGYCGTCYSYYYGIPSSATHRHSEVHINDFEYNEYVVCTYR